MARKETKETKHNLPPKKTLKVFRGGLHSALYYIGYEEGGEKAKELKVSFNSRKLAEQFLAEYLEKKSANKSYLEHVRDKENAASKDEAGI